MSGRETTAMRAALEKGGVAFVDDVERRGIMAPRSTGIVEADKSEGGPVGDRTQASRVEIQLAAPSPGPFRRS